MAQAHAAPSSLGPHGEWRRAYHLASLEQDPLLLFKRIEVAEAAVRLRREAIARGAGSLEERRLLEDALHGLKELKRERLNFSEDDYSNNLSCEDFSSQDF